MNASIILPILALALSACGVVVGLFGPILTVLGMWLANRVESAKTQATFAEQIGAVRSALTEMHNAYGALSEKVQTVLTSSALSAQLVNKHNEEISAIKDQIGEMVKANTEAHETATRERHAFREEINGALRDMERRLTVTPARKRAA